jgi:putative FmdB family regulatory protein
MPLYEYLCQDCDRQSELLISGGQQPVCPECGGTHLSKLLSVVAAPSREASAGRQQDRPTGPCGSHCGCFSAN